ncbi:MAG: hypothetical protein JWP88_128 [Flaviaesturariibacter sp.]|nr:hypothetical protein [Flaviaesturariibacter sp.]
MRYKIVLYLYIFSNLSFNCRGQYHEGSIVRESTFYGLDTLKKAAPLHILSKIYYNGTSSIQEVPLLSYTDDSSGKKTVVTIKHYSYLNEDKGVCFNYLNFTDTATLIKCYFDVDSVKIDGGWNFYSNEKFEYDNLTMLSDTIINNSGCRRIRLDKNINGNSVNFILYVDCTRKYSPVRIFKSLSDSIGCPIIRDDTFVKGVLFMTRELKYLSDHLSKTELEVFAAWGKYAKEHSANK